MQEKETVQEKFDLKTLALKNAKDEVQDLKLNTMNLIIANQILTAENTAKDGTSSVDLNGSKQNALNLSNFDNDEDLNDPEDCKSIKELVADLKDNLSKLQNDNNKLKQDLANSKINIEAERKSFHANLISDINPPSLEIDFENKNKELEYLLETHCVRIENHDDFLKEIISKSNSDREKEIAYYLMKTKIFEQIAKASFKQQTTSNEYYKQERQTLISNYEKTIDRLKKRIDDNKIAERQVSENLAASKDLKQAKIELNNWKSKALKYKSALSELYQLKKKCKDLKFQSRETGRILFDQNEFAREDCIKGLAEIKQKLLIFTETIEYLDHQASEARKVVFDKNNQIGKYFNQVQEHKRQVEDLTNKNDHLESDIKSLRNELQELKDSQKSKPYLNSSYTAFEQVFPKPEKLKATAKFNFNILNENDYNLDQNDKNQWEENQIEIDENIDNFDQKDNNNNDPWNQELNIEEDIDIFDNFNEVEKIGTKNTNLPTKSIQKVEQAVLDDADNFWSLGGGKQNTKDSHTIDEKLKTNKHLQTNKEVQIVKASTKAQEPFEDKFKIKEETIKANEIPQQEAKSQLKIDDNLAPIHNSDDFFTSFASDFKTHQNNKSNVIEKKVEQRPEDICDFNLDDSIKEIKEAPKEDDLDVDIQDGWGIDTPDQIPIDDIDIADIEVEKAEQPTEQESQQLDFLITKPDIKDEKPNQDNIKELSVDNFQKDDNSEEIDIADNTWGNEELDIEINSEEPDLLEEQKDEKCEVNQFSNENQDIEQFEEALIVDSPEQPQAAEQIQIQEHKEKIESEDSYSENEEDRVPIELVGREDIDEDIDGHDEGIKIEQDDIEIDEMGWGNEIDNQIIDFENLEGNNDADVIQQHDLNQNETTEEQKEEIMNEQQKDEDIEEIGIKNDDNEIRNEDNHQIQEIQAVTQEDLDEFNTDFQQNKCSFPANESPDCPIVEDNQENEIAEVSDNQSIHNSQSSKKIEENSQEESNAVNNENSREEESQNQNYISEELDQENIFDLAYEEYEPTEDAKVAQFEYTEENQDIIHYKDDENEGNEENEVYEHPIETIDNPVNQEINPTNLEVDINLDEIDEELNNLKSWGATPDDIQIPTDDLDEVLINHQEDPMNLLDTKEIADTNQNKEVVNNDEDDIVIDDSWNQQDLEIDDFDI